MSDPTTTTTKTTAKPDGAAKRIALLGLLLSLLGGVSYFFLLDVPWIRSSAVPNVVLTAVGLLLSFYALYRARGGVVITAAVLSLLVGGGFLASLYLLMNLPTPSESWTVGQDIPDFELPDQDGELIRLSSFVGKGPVLLVFYRGHW